MATKRTSEVYKRIYHYTNLEGAWGILASNCLWSTQVKQMNDSSEMTLFKEPLKKFLCPHVLDQYNKMMTEFPNAAGKIEQSGGLGTVVKFDTDVVIRAMYHALGDELYITSFSGEHKDEYTNTNGLLSQWRAYGGNGGIALIFDTEKLEAMLKLEATTFDGYAYIADVIYSDDDTKFADELSEPLSDIAAYVVALFASMKLHHEKAPNVGKAMEAFIQCAMRYKHRSFKEENEVRIVAMPVAHNKPYLTSVREQGTILTREKPRHFRGTGQYVPYISLFGDLGKPLPIERIIVGPHREREARAAALAAMVRRTEIEITISDIPFAT